MFLAGVSQVPATEQADQVVPVAPASLGSSTLFAAQDCAACHSAITQQWQGSAHAHAATDAYYQAVTTLFIEERGPDAVRYCATCHNPIGLMQGEVDVMRSRSRTSRAARPMPHANSASRCRSAGGLPKG